MLTTKKRATPKHVISAAWRKLSRLRARLQVARVSLVVLLPHPLRARRRAAVVVEVEVEAGVHRAAVEVVLLLRLLRRVKRV